MCSQIHPRANLPFSCLLPLKCLLDQGIGSSLTGNPCKNLTLCKGQGAGAWDFLVVRMNINCHSKFVETPARTISSHSLQSTLFSTLNTPIFFVDKCPISNDLCLNGPYGR